MATAPSPPPADASAVPRLTFILPTRNRRAWVGRAIDCCLAVDRPGAGVEVLVIDGNSTDGSFEELTARYGSDPRVRLMRQQGAKGFMPACFFAVPLVRTALATFMYDDDVLSPYWSDLVAELDRRGADFIMGFGAEGDLARPREFARVTQLILLSPSALLRAYCGRGRELSTREGLPFSPVACLTRTDWLREWTQALERFTRGRPLREYFMMRRNAGPDLMIYFFSIIQHAGDIAVFDGPVAQFSAHEESITSGLEPTDLTIGYWLAHVWLGEQLRSLGRAADAGWCGAYTVKQGIRLLLKRARRGRGAWLGALARETAGVATRALFSRAGASFGGSFFTLLLPRGWRPLKALSLRREAMAVSERIDKSGE